MNKNQFLPQDEPAAIAEIKAAFTCIDRIGDSLMKGDLQEAKLTVSDLSKSLRELERLAEKKQRHDRLMQVVLELNKKGVLASMVERAR